MKPHRLLLLLVLCAACVPDEPPPPDDDDAASVDDDDSAPMDDDDDVPIDDDDSAPMDDDDDVPPVMVEPSGVRSALYPPDWTPETTDTEGRFLHDFSYAGYRRGEAPLPTSVPGPTFVVTDALYGADPTGVADSTAALQAALDDAAAAGGGTVVLPEGTYRVAPPEGASSALRVEGSGVLVRGAGRDATFLLNDDPVMRNASVIRLGPSSTSSWTNQSAGSPVALTEDADERATSVRVDDSTPFFVGQDVVVRADAGDAWIAEHGMTGRWNSGVPGPTFHRTITAIDGDVLHLDIPLRYPVLLRDDARVFPALPHLREVGLQDLSIGMVRNPGSGFGDNDYGTPGTGAHDVHGADVIHVNGVVDGWILRVGTYAPEGNQGVEMLSDGVVIAQARNITVQEAHFSHPQYEGGGGNGYSFVLQGSDSLLVDCSSVSARHAFSWKKSYSHGNVVLRGSSSAPRLATDFHMHLSMSNLVDGAVLEGDFIDATYRPWGTVEHGFTTTHTVLWATTGLDDGGGPGRLVDSRQYDWGAVIGTRGPVQGIQTTPLTDTLSTAPEDFAELEGGAGVLLPASLYEDQLARRLTGAPAPTAVEESRRIVLDVDADGHVRGGSWSSDVYEGAEALQVKDSGPEYLRHAFLRFDLSSLDVDIERAVLILEARTSDGGGDVAELRAAASRGPWDPATLSFDTAPTVEVANARAVTGPDWAPVMLDVTRLVRSRSDDLFTVALTQDMGGSGLNVAVRSLESGVPARLELVLDDREPLPVAAVDGDAPAEDTTLEGAVDGDFETRWSNDARGASITLDLGAVVDIDRVDVAWFKGDVRLSWAELRTSEDGTTWMPVRSLRGSGETTEFERFPFPPLSARWVRLVGFGNSESAWNSITEVAVYGE